MDFYDLDLCDELLDAIDDMRFTNCTPIQEQAIPPVLEGRDLIGIAQTGTGKTAAYLLPVLDKMLRGEGKKNGTCLIMVPTRELAEQIDRQVQAFTYYTDLSCASIYGGGDGSLFEQQKRALQDRCDVIVATPGRLISHMGMAYCDLSMVGFLILDEADRMLDMGFHEDIMQIYRQIKGEHPQTLMFSATMPENIKKLTEELLVDPFHINIAPNKPAEGVNQQACICHEAQKLTILGDLLEKMSIDRGIVFASTKLKVKDITRKLLKMNLDVDQMHSDLDQRQRETVMDRFRSRQTKLLVATDILARGIDIEDIQLVVNFDVPHDPEDYVHRVGRTARAQTKGMAVTLVSDDDRRRFAQIERFLEKKVTRMPLPEGMEAPEETSESGERHGVGRGKGRKPSGRGRQGGKRRPERQKKTDSTPKMTDGVKPASENSGPVSPRKPHGRHHGRKSHSSQKNTSSEQPKKAE